MRRFAHLARCHRCLFLSLQYISVLNSILGTYKQLSMGESLASSAVKTSIDVEAKAIVVMSESGTMTNYVAKFRPGVPILCVTPNSAAARQMSGLLLGVHTVVVDSVANFAELVEEISYEMTHSGSFDIDDKIIFIAGRRAGDQMEQLQVVDLTAGKSYGHIIKTIGGVFYFNPELLMKFGGQY
jgi:pyruvate kinase